MGLCREAGIRVALLTIQCVIMKFNVGRPIYDVVPLVCGRLFKRFALARFKCRDNKNRTERTSVMMGEMKRRAINKNLWVHLVRINFYRSILMAQIAEAGPESLT